MAGVLALESGKPTAFEPSGAPFGKTPLEKEANAEKSTAEKLREKEINSRVYS